MNLKNILAVLTLAILSLTQESSANTDDTLLSSILTPKDDKEVKLIRQQRSNYAQRYGFGQPYDTQDYDKPARCARCLDNRDDGYDRPRDRYDDDRRQENRPTYGSRFDRNRNDDDNERKYAMDRNNEGNNVTDKDNDRDNRTRGDDRYGDKDRNRYDDRDRYGDKDRYGDRDSSGGRDRFYRDRYGDRGRYGTRDRYGDRDNWLDYYDRFGRERPFERRYYADLYDRERRPLFDRYPYSDPYDYGFAGTRYDGTGYDRQFYDDRYDRGNTYDNYGGYGPGFGRGAHDSFRPWDETYRGQAGWDAAGRGYYFASGRPDSAPAAAWARPDYTRPESGWQNVDYSGAYRNQIDYRSASYPQSAGYDQNVGYGQNVGYRQDQGYRQDLGYRQDTGYGRLSGWHSVGERRPYRDQSGVNQLDNRGSTDQVRNNQGLINTVDRGQAAYGQTFGQSATYDRPGSYDRPTYGQPNNYGQSASYTQSAKYGQPSNYGQSSTFGQSNNFQNNMATNGFGQTSSTTPATSYLYQREDAHVTIKPPDGSTKSPS